jgi:hypothetical protein
MRTFALALLVLVLPLSACRRETETTMQPPSVSAPAAPAPVPAPAPARVTSIDLGSELGADGRLAPGAAKTTFAPNDTIYASVLTDSPPAGATLSARWTFEDGQVVNESREELTSSDRNATEFHVSKPDGWPAGRYKVEIALNGQPSGEREFEVR